MNRVHQYHPVIFFTLAITLSWIPWFFAAYTTPSNITALLIFMGLLGPMFAAIIMLCHVGFSDVLARLRDLSYLLSYKFWIVLISIPLIYLLAAYLSLLLGYSADQIRISDNFVMMLPLAIVAPLIEELGWRTYGVDSLKSKYGITCSTLIFALLWGIWHIPLFFIHGLYQNSLIALGNVYIINFFISILPAAFIINWIYYQHKRSIYAAIFFHFTLVASAELFALQPFTKCIVTGLLIPFTLILLNKGWGDDKRK